MIFVSTIILFSACETDEEYDHEAEKQINAAYTMADNLEAGDQGANYENYNEYVDNPFIQVSEQDISTFSIDADGASYANMRRFINNEMKPPLGAVRAEEFINYFTYNYSDNSPHPVSVNGEVCQCPWQTQHKLIRIGIKGKDISRSQLPPSNFVLLIDVSGSMGVENKLPLLKESLKLFVDNMSQDDKIAIVTYAGEAGVVLPSTNGAEKQLIKQAIDGLGSGGSTAGSDGIITAYKIAQDNFVKNGNNRVILGTDGDFNVGLTGDALIDLIEEKREHGIFLTVLGLGTGNYNDAAMEQLANKGNGNLEYIDKIEQAKKVFIYEFNKFYTIAKDVKVQVKFNPNVVQSYRLIGYENRMLQNDEFNDDKKDAGEIGVGQTITALYEIKPASADLQKSVPVFEIYMRYKEPDMDLSKKIEFTINDSNNTFEAASEDMRFASAVASFAMCLRDSPYKGNSNADKIIGWADNARSFDPHRFRSEFVQLVETFKTIP